MKTIGYQGPLWYPIVFICLGWAVLYGWLYLRTRSLLAPILAHGLANATFYTFENQFPLLSQAYDARAPLGDWLFAAVGVGLAVMVLILDRKLFFGPRALLSAEDWVEPDVRGGGSGALS